MTNIKVGDKLKYQSGEDEVKVLGVLGDLYFISYADDKNRGAMHCTLEGLKDVFEIKEEEPGCVHRYVHTEKITRENPMPRCFVIETTCADCGEKLKQVDVR